MSMLADLVSLVPASLEETNLVTRRDRLMNLCLLKKQFPSLLLNVEPLVNAVCPPLVEACVWCRRAAMKPCMAWSLTLSLCRSTMPMVELKLRTRRTVRPTPTHGTLPQTDPGMN